MTDKSKNDSDKFAPWRDLKTAIGFFTRLPIPFEGEFNKDALAKSVWAFPIAGLVVGIIGAFIFSITLALNLNIWIAALLTVGGTAITTGALHEDGLSDFCDGLWGGFTPERRLEIMRDSAIGGYGALALIIATGLKVAAIGSMNPAYVVASLIAAHCISRGVLPVLMNHMDPAGKPGLAASVGKPDRTFSLISLTIGIVLVLGLLGPTAGVTSTALVAILTFGIIKLAQQKLEGYNGDTLGATQQICEIAVLICCASFFANQG